ncbi:MAG: hypothetical protein QM811_22635 [Pirellulales bacterium]
MNKVVAAYPNGTLAGEPVMLVEGFRLLETDGLRLEWISTGLVLLTLLLSFRSPRWMILPLVLGAVLVVGDAGDPRAQRLSHDHGQLDAVRHVDDHRRRGRGASDHQVSGGTSH